MHIDVHIISVTFSFQFANMIINRIGTTQPENTFRSFPSSNFRTGQDLVCTFYGERSLIEPFVQTLHLDKLTLFGIILFKSPKRFFTVFLINYLFNTPFLAVIRNTSIFFSSFAGKERENLAKRFFRSMNFKMISLLFKLNIVHII